MRMAAKKLTVNSLEKKAGLKRSAVRNILLGISKKPSAEIVQALAKALECTIEDLVGTSGSHGTSTLLLKNITPKATGKNFWNEKLYSDSIKTSVYAFTKHNEEITFEKIIQLATEVYKYSLAKKDDKADENFANWLVEKTF